MARCELCGKGPQFGHNVSHSKVRTNRIWKPNVQSVTLYVDGRPKKIKICTRCLRTYNKQAAG
ncbi:MAG: 50S ribosomal protein L28 [Chloroflexi bacterium]|nr:50S ribosomal protein L28 [Chloroflexota bacterium]